jgi:hypothetical protein
MSINFCSGQPEKREKISVHMTLDKKAYARHAQAVAALLPDFKAQMEKDDDLKVSYDLFINYFGDVVRCLEAVKKICSDPDVVITASCPELEQGRLLIYEALKRLDSVIKTVRDRA